MNKERTAVFLLLIGTVFWGMTFVFIKEGVSIISVYSFLFFRFIIASLILLLLFYKRLSNFNYKTIKYGIFLGIPLFLAFVLQTVGLQTTTASNGGFISGLSVVFVPVLTSLINKKIPEIKVIISVILATAGLGLLTISNSFVLNKGDLLMLISAFTFAIYIIMVAKYAKHFDAILISLVQFILIVISSLMITLTEHNFVFPKTYLVWQAILFTAIFATAYMYTVQNHYQKYISEIKTAIIFSLEPFFAAITAYFYLHETLTTKIVIGGVLIFTGMIITELKK